MPSHYGLFAARATAMRNVLAHNVRCNVRDMHGSGSNVRSSSNGSNVRVAKSKEKHNA